MAATRSYQPRPNPGILCAGAPRELDTRNTLAKQDHRNADNAMRAYPEVTAAGRRRGITPGKTVAFYCGTGWRSSEAWFHAYLMGGPRIAVYDGGWLEWAQDPSNPIAQGDDFIELRGRNYPGATAEPMASGRTIGGAFGI